MKHGMKHDFLNDPPAKAIGLYAVTLTCSSIFAQIFSIVSTVIVGRGLSADALGGMGIVGPINSMLIGFVTSVCNGFAIRVNIQYGSSDYRAMRRYLANGLILSALLSVFVGGAGALCCRGILTLMHTPADLFGYAHIYIVTQLLALPVTMSSSFLSSLIRSLGNSKLMLVFGILSTASSFLLSVAMMLFLSWGLFGLAFGSAIANLIWTVVYLGYLKRKTPFLDFERQDWKLSRALVADLMKTGIPLGITIVLIAGGQLILQSEANRLGKEAATALSTSDQLWAMLFIPIANISLSLSTFVGQNYGAGRLDRVDSGLKFSTFASIVWCGILFLATNVFNVNFAAMYLKPEETVTRGYLNACMRFFAVMYLFLALLYTFKYAVEGMGFGKFSILQGIGELSARLLASFVLIPALGFAGVKLAGPLAWVMGAGMLMLSYFQIRKRAGLSAAAEQAAGRNGPAGTP